MKKNLIMTLALGLILVFALTAFAQEAVNPRLVRLEGWVVDEPSGAKHANADSKDAVLEAHEQGAQLVFVSKAGDIYELGKQEEALEHVGQNWLVLGKLDPNGTLTVGTYIDPSKRKGPPPKPAE